MTTSAKPTPLSASDLIERAARALSTWSDEMWEQQVAKESTAVLICRKQAWLAINAIAPGLLADPPTAWIAPMHTTEAMRAAFIRCLDDDAVIGPQTGWDAMRDAHLKAQSQSADTNGPQAKG